MRSATVYLTGYIALSFVFISCQSPSCKLVADRRYQAIEDRYHVLCIEQKDLVLAADYAFKTKAVDPRMAVYAKSAAFSDSCGSLVSDAKIAYAGLSKRERRECLLKLLKADGYVPSTETLFFWGLKDSDLAPYLAAMKTQAPPIKIEQ